MALTRKMLKAMGIEEEKIDQIIEAHTETVDSFKDKLNDYKDKAEKYDDVKKQLDDLKDGDNDWQKKYEKEHSDFEAYKNDVTTKETKRTKEHAFREILKGANVSKDWIDTIVQASASDIDSVELDKDGKATNTEKIAEQVKTKWAKCVETTTTKGANTANPPANNGKGTTKTKEEIMAIKDGATRRAEMAKNPELFGLETK